MRAAERDVVGVMYEVCLDVAQALAEAFARDAQ
jgi:hypothetical protein